MNPNSNLKIESYLGGGHELVRRASTTEGPPDGAAHDSIARGAGGRTRSGASGGGRGAQTARQPARASGGGRAKGGRPTQARAALSRASAPGLRLRDLRA